MVEINGGRAKIRNQVRADLQPLTNHRMDGSTINKALPPVQANGRVEATFQTFAPPVTDPSDRVDSQASDTGLLVKLHPAGNGPPFLLFESRYDVQAASDTAPMISTSTDSCVPVSGPHPRVLLRGSKALHDKTAWRMMWQKSTDELVTQNHIQKRLVNSDVAVIAAVFDKAELTKPIHENAHARSGGPNHLCQRFLRDLWNRCPRFPRFTEFRH